VRYRALSSASFADPLIIGYHELPDSKQMTVGAMPLSGGDRPSHPGVPNWLDPAGHRPSAPIFNRWLCARHAALETYARLAEAGGTQSAVAHRRGAAITISLRDLPVPGILANLSESLIR